MCAGTLLHYEQAARERVSGWGGAFCHRECIARAGARVAPHSQVHYSYDHYDVDKTGAKCCLTINVRKRLEHVLPHV